MRAGLLAGAARQPGSKPHGGTNGRASLKAIAISQREATLGARLRLLEGFLNRSEIADCAQHALVWLAETLDVPRSLCLVRAPG